MSETIRIVQVNEKAFIVQEKGCLWGWNTWQSGVMDASWDAVWPTREEAIKEIQRHLDWRKQRADAKAFPRKVVWP